MKKVIFPILLFFAVTAFYACKKEGSDPAPVINDSTHVGDSCGKIVPFHSNEILVLTPSTTSYLPLSGQLFIEAKTSDSTYTTCQDSIRKVSSFEGNGISINYLGVGYYDQTINAYNNCDCISDTGYLSSTSTYNTFFPVPNGPHPFTVIFKGNTYTGSFIKTGTTYIFTWPYTSGVIFSTLVAQ